MLDISTLELDKNIKKVEVKISEDVTIEGSVFMSFRTLVSMTQMSDEENGMKPMCDFLIEVFGEDVFNEHIEPLHYEAVTKIFEYVTAELNKPISE